MFHIGNPWNLGKVPLQIHALNGTIGSLRRSPRIRLEASMGKAEQYRRYAGECIRLAQQSQHPQEKDVLLGMAAAWRRLAEHAESTSEREPDSEPK
jgi:hypothetical protein